MKLIKLLAVGILIAASIMTIFTACNTDKETGALPSANSTVSSAVSESNAKQSDGKQLDPKKSADLKKEMDIQSGAKVKEGFDEKGNQTFQYENPDGTGGGGVVID